MRAAATRASCSSCIDIAQGSRRLCLEALAIDSTFPRSRASAVIAKPCRRLFNSSINASLRVCGDSPNFRRNPRYGICLDSVAKIPSTTKFDIVILDESEQVLAHFLSETMDRGGGSRDRIFVEFTRLLNQANT